MLALYPLHSAHPPFLQGGGWTSGQIFKKGGLEKLVILRGELPGKRGVDILRGGVQILQALTTDIARKKIVMLEKSSTLSSKISSFVG